MVHGNFYICSQCVRKAKHLAMIRFDWTFEFEYSKHELTTSIGGHDECRSNSIWLFLLILRTLLPEGQVILFDPRCMISYPGDLSAELETKNLTVNCKLVNGNHPNFNISQCLLVPFVQDFQTFLGIKQVTEWEKKRCQKRLVLNN